MNIGSIKLKKEDHADDDNFLKNNLFKFKLKDIIKIESNSANIKQKEKLIENAEEA